MGLSPNDFWEMDQAEFRAAQEGWQRRYEDQMTLNATLAAWIVNSLPIPFVKNRKPVQPQALLGKDKGLPGFGSPEEFKSHMKKRAAKG